MVADDTHQTSKYSSLMYKHFSHSATTACIPTQNESMSNISSEEGTDCFTSVAHHLSYRGL